MSVDDPRSERRVPWRSIWATIASLLVTLVGVLVVLELRRLLIWLLVAAFFAIALNPGVDLFVRRLRMRRGVATISVLVLGLVLLTGMAFVFVRPLVEEGGNLADDLPAYVEDVQNGKGPVGELLSRYGLDDRLKEQSGQLSSDVTGLGSRSLAVLGSVGSAVVATLTVFVLTFMLLLEGDRLLAGALALVPDRHRDHVSRVAQDCARAVTGYVTGNLVISVVAGVSSFVMLIATGTPFAGLLALWVGLTDLIPLVGATLGAVVVVLVAFIASPTAGVVALVFFVVYQQVENHVLQPAVQSRTVRLNPLTVLVAALAGVELAGLLGALLAIPVAGVITVILRDVNVGLRSGLTVGVDEVPVDRATTHSAFIDRDEHGDVITPEARARAIEGATEPAATEAGRRSPRATTPRTTQAGSPGCDF